MLRLTLWLGTCLQAIPKHRIINWINETGEQIRNDEVLTRHNTLETWAKKTPTSQKYFCLFPRYCDQPELCLLFMNCSPQPRFFRLLYGAMQYYFAPIESDGTINTIEETFYRSCGSHGMSSVGNLQCNEMLANIFSSFFVVCSHSDCGALGLWLVWMYWAHMYFG